MPEPDAFDPTHALDGWRPPAPAPVQELDLDALLHPAPKHAQPLLAHAGADGLDPTHVLDGWRPPAPAPLDLELKSLLRAVSVPDEAKLARLKARGYEMLDVEDIELVEAPSMPRVLVEASVLEVPPAPRLAEADLVLPPLGKDTAQVAGAVEVPLPDEEVWPLFMAEAQILEPDAAPPAKAAAAETPTERPAAEVELNFDEVAPAFESPGLEVPAPEPEVEPVPRDELEPVVSALSEAMEAPATEEGPNVEPEAEPLPSVERALVEARAVEVVVAEPELAAADEDQVVENAVAPEIEVASTAIVETLPEPEPEPEPEPALSVLVDAVEPAPEDELEPLSSVIAEAPETMVTAELAEAEAVGEPVPSGQAELPPALAAEAPTMEAPVVEPERATADEGVEAVAPEFEAPVAAAVAQMSVSEPEPALAPTDPFEPALSVLADAVEPAPEDELEPLFSVIAEAPWLETAELTLLVADDQRVPEGGDFAAEPQVAEPPIEPPAPASPPMPSFIDEIQLPSVPLPPAEFEAPVLDFRAAPPPPEPDPASVIAGIELPRVTPPPAVVEMPELDIAVLTPRPPEPDPRLQAQWQAGAWTALARQVAGASEELLQTSDGLRVESHASQWLCAIWPPQGEDAPLGRWPELASLVAAETRAHALQQLLDELPDRAPLWSADLEADWDLVAELVLHQDTGLRPSQAQALHALALAERGARMARLGEGYALQGRVARRRA